MKILSKPKKLRVILAMPVVQTRWTPLMKLRKMDHPQCKKKSKQKRSNFSKKITQKMRRLKKILTIKFSSSSNTNTATCAKLSNPLGQSTASLAIYAWPRSTITAHGSATA